MKIIHSEEYEELKSAFENDSPVAVRLNPEKFQISTDIERIPWCETGYYLKERPSFTLDPVFHAGAYYVQEPCSMFMEQVFNRIVNPSEPLLILDLCGAPGGKSTHLLSLMNKQSLLVTNEVIRPRAAILAENIRKWGYSNVLVTNNDPRDFASLGEIFDIIVVDAPCSGEGLFRKEPQAIAEWSVENTIHCAARQRRILAEAWQCLKSGGFLIYSTCTFNPEENEVNLNWLTDQKNAISIPVTTDPLWNIKEINYRNITGYQFLPHRVKGEGFFMGILQKTDGNLNTVQVKKNYKIQLADSNLRKQLSTWMNNPEAILILDEKNQLILFNVNQIRYLEFFIPKLKIIDYGCPMAVKVRNQINPLPAFALSVDLNKMWFERSDLTLEQAIKFLKRESFPVDSTANGWILVNYKKVPLGWIKNLGNRFNNYFPGSWRIRMPVNEIPRPWHDETFQ